MAGDGESVHYERSPTDLLRLCIAVPLVLVGFLLAEAATDTMIGFESDVLRFFDGLPDGTQRFLIGIVQVVAIGAPLAAVGTLVAFRRWRALLLGVLAGVVAGVAFFGLQQWVHLDSFGPLAHTQTDESWILGAAFPNSPYLAALSAALTAISPEVSRRWRRWAWAVLVFAVAGRVIAGAGAALDLTLALATGWTVGLLVLLAFGVRDRHPSATAIRAAMDRAGLPVRELRPAAVDARGSTPYFATLDDDDRVFVKVLSADERDADLLFRLYRRIRLRDVGDEAPFSSLRRTVEHEALVSLRATDLGVRTPHFLAVAPVAETSMLLAYEAIDGASLDSVPDDAITDAVLAELWHEVALLRERKVAHRDLRLANVFLDDDQHPWLIDFGFSELAETDDVLASDVGELIVSTAFKVGPQRAVAAAVSALGTDAVAAAAPRIQPLALSHATRSELKARKGFADEVRHEIQQQCDLGEIEYERLERISPRSLFLWLFAGIAVYVLIHQITNVKGAVEQVKDLDWKWVLPLLAVSLMSYVGGAFAMAGSVPNALPAWPLFMTQFASSFTNRVTPAKVGGTAVNIRFLQKSGVDNPVAVTGVGLVLLFGMIVHICFIVVFVLFAGQEHQKGVKLPSEQDALLVLATLMLLLIAILVLPIGRRLAIDRVVPLLKRAWSGAEQVAHQPSKMGLLVGGSAIVTLSYATALYISVLAFGGGIGFAAVVALYLTAGAVAGAAPTPGGLGAVEAVLIAGLVGLGLDNEVAVPAVFLFRLATFWLPTIPGWFAFHSLTKRELL